MSEVVPYPLCQPCQACFCHAYQFLPSGPFEQWAGRSGGAQIEVHGLNKASAIMKDKFAVHDKDGGELAPGH